MLHQSEVAPGYNSQTVMRRPASGKSSGRRTIAFTTPKIVVVSPMHQREREDRGESERRLRAQAAQRMTKVREEISH